MVSGTISLSCSEYFSPFPHGTSSLSVTCLYLVLADGPAGFLQGSTCPVVLGCVKRRSNILSYRALTVYGRPSQTVLIIFDFLTPPLARMTSHNPIITSYNGLDSSPFARHYSGNHILFSFPLGTEMFQFPRYRFFILCIQIKMTL